MNKKFTGLVLAAMLLGTSASYAVEEYKIAILDMQKAIQNSESGKKAKAELEAEFNKKKKELQRQETALKKDQEAFQKKAAALSESAKQSQQAELQKKFMKYQELLQSSQAEIQKKEQEMSQPIIAKIKEKSTEIAKKKGYALVLEKNENIVIFSKDQDDITDDVMKAMN